MSKLSDLIEKIGDEDLRERIQLEVNRLQKQKKFGLVFEDHMPEACRLPDVPIRVGSRVSRKTDSPSETYFVRSIQDNIASCSDYEQKNCFDAPLDQLVCVALFGEPIYPYLKMLDKVQNAPNLDLWHALIEADNYHALQLLAYLYPAKVDCIYIDPPYNTGARDWKYNNDYVDEKDAYRHSKWLSMMKRRLELAKILLNPKDSVMIVTIDEKEYLHLGCLLEEMFPEARIQMISSIINQRGSARQGMFHRTNEFIYILMFGCSLPSKMELSPEWHYGKGGGGAAKGKLIWETLRRRGTGDNALRKYHPDCFYPIYVSKDGSKIVEVGDALKRNEDKSCIKDKEGCITLIPMRGDGEEGRWQLGKDTLLKAMANGFVKLGKVSSEDNIVISYLKSGEQQKVKDGLFHVIGHNPDGSIIVDDSDYVPTIVPGTQWNLPLHDAGQYGSNMITQILGENRFTFPKSLYAVHDVIKFFVNNKPDALILDFFAGSGTTMHAVNLLNAEDGGHRRCIMVTNNEVSDAEAKELTKKGFKPGDEEWEQYGIARYVNWPRTVCSIEGHDLKGKSLKGMYHGCEIPMANGFAANSAFFQLGFLDKNSVRLGRQFREMLPLLWMKAGAINACPELPDEEIPSMLIYPENKFAVLTEESSFYAFEKAISELGGIDTIYIVTDSEPSYREMIALLHCKQSFQLYRDYLDNFRINKAR